MSKVKRYGKRVGFEWTYTDMVLASDYDALAADNAALREDAERYRWLRSPQSGQAGWWHIKYNVDPVKIDAAIDAARAAALAPAKEQT